VVFFCTWLGVSPDMFAGNEYGDMGHIRNTAQFVQKRELVLNMCITSQ
jgi:hypothetical protein